MKLTNLDGEQFELDLAMIKEMHDRTYFREIRTIMKDVLQVKESIAEIRQKIMAERKDCK